MIFTYHAVQLKHRESFEEVIRIISVRKADGLEIKQ